MRLIGIVEDGAEAISYLLGVGQFSDRQMFPYPELMLLDFQMPRCNGLEVLEFLRFQLARPRVVLWSSNPEQIDEPLALSLGADLICGKPDNSDQLAQIIHRVQANVFGGLNLSPCDKPAAVKPLPA